MGWLTPKKDGGTEKIHVAPNPKLKTLISIYPGFAAVIIAFFKDHIIAVTKQGITYVSGLIGFEIGNEKVIIFLVILYWCLFIYWIATYFRTILREANSNKRQTENNQKLLDKIDSAIHNAPNPSFFKNSLVLIDAIRKEIQITEYLTSVGQAGIQDYIKSIDKILNKLCEITHLFTNDGRAVFKPNLMIYINNNSHNENYIKELMKKPERWIYNTTVDLKYVKFVLDSVDLSDPAANYYTPAALGICKGENEKNTRIPGAPDAISLDDIAIVNNTNFLDDEFKDIDEKILTKAKSYFKTTGKHIKSIISIRVHKPGIPEEVANHCHSLSVLGVINLDANIENPLGGDKEYLLTYYALIGPIIGMIAPFIDKYFSMHPELKKVANYI